MYDKAMLVAFYFIENNTHLTLEGARGSTAVPLKKRLGLRFGPIDPDVLDQLLG